jgi:hypothetical protein
MQTSPNQEQPAKRPPAGPYRGAPPTHASHVLRKTAAIRTGRYVPVETEELREHGYGHGV